MQPIDEEASPQEEFLSFPIGTIEFVKTASLPDLDTTVLAGFGLGQGPYLTKSGECGEIVT